MKLPALLCCAASVAGAVLYRPQTDPGIRVIVLGNHRGYLSPCGCTTPMLGGILREATEVRALQKLGPNLVVDSGNLSGTTSSREQEILKAQTLCQTLESLKVSAVNLGFIDSKLGTAELQNLQSLMGKAWVSGSVANPAGLTVDKSAESGGFLIGGVSMNGGNLARQLGARAVDPGQAAQALLDEAASRQLKTILLVDGDRPQATELIRSHPGLDLVVYNSTSRPPAEPIKEGKTLLISPGERGEYLVGLQFRGDGSVAYQPVTLGEDVVDDDRAGRFYKTYLQRISEHHLWENYPRITGKPFAGSEACAKCHGEDYRIWKASDHAKALQTISNKGHDKDPECLPCHVTGADVKTGFRSLQTTPHLAFVGCESCHGPAAAHASKPYLFRLPKVKVATCTICHEQLNSPHFDFTTYWAKIRHGLVEKGWKK